MGRAPSVSLLWSRGFVPDFRRYSNTGVSRLCGCCGPCCQDVLSFLGCGWCAAGPGNPGGDHDAAELGEHVLEGGLGFGGVPRLGRAAAGNVGVVVTVPGVPDHDQRAGQHGERDSPLDRAADAVAGLAAAQDVADVAEGLLDGLITNDKFCCVRRLRLSLTWWRRPLRLRASVLQTDIALSGEPDDPDPDVDRLPPAQRAPRRRAPVGSGLPAAAGALGVPGRGALPDADRRGGA